MNRRENNQKREANKYRLSESDKSAGDRRADVGAHYDRNGVFHFGNGYLNRQQTNK